MNAKICGKCKEEKNVSQFHKDSGRSGGLNSYCIDCQREKLRPMMKKIQLNSTYRKLGITQEDFNDMFIKQGGKCKICGKHQSDLKKTLSVDHDHGTGKIRGLLCTQCNLGIGYFYDNIEMLQSVINYLEYYK